MQYISITTNTRITVTVCQAAFNFMEQVLQIIRNRIASLVAEQAIQYMGGDYYDELQARINELEGLMDELSNVA